MTIERFEREYVEYNGLSEKRAVEQVKTLRQFEDHAGKPLTQCGGEEFRAFLSHLLDSGLHVNTVAKKAGMIRPYFGWAFDVGLVNGDTLHSVTRVSDPKGSTKKTTPKPYPAKELRRFWAALPEAWPYTTELKLRRWRKGTSPYRSVWRHAMRLQLEAIIRLALDCGLRRQEIYAVEIDDIHPDNFYVVIRNGKRESARRDKTREVPFTKKSRAAVERWLNFRQEILKRARVKDHGRVWLSLKNPTATKAMRWERFERILGTVGQDRDGANYSLHRLRHTCGTNWVRVGVPSEIVSRLLGHANLQQTLCYVELARDDIHAAIHKHEDAFERLANAQEE